MQHYIILLTNVIRNTVMKIDRLVPKKVRCDLEFMISQEITDQQYCSIYYFIVMRVFRVLTEGMRYVWCRIFYDQCRRPIH